MKHKQIGKQIIHLPGKLLLVLTAVTTLFFCTEVSANASIEAVHSAADICMMTNRALKSYALAGMDVEFHNPKEELKANLALVDDHFKELKGHKVNKKLAAEILEIETGWNELKPEFQQTPDKTKMHGLLKKMEKYTLRCEEVTEDLAQDSKIEGERYVVLVAKLGMESQRIAAEYMAHAWGIEDPLYEDEIDHIIAEIESIFKELLEADDKLVSKEIKEKLEDVKRDFIAFGIMAKSKTKRFMPVAAEKSADKIHDKIQEILHMEQELVEGKVSGYFLPIADEKTAGEIFRSFTGIVQVQGGIKS